jgi:hypothetical protein
LGAEVEGILNGPNGANVPILPTEAERIQQAQMVPACPKCHTPMAPGLIQLSEAIADHGPYAENFWIGGFRCIPCSKPMIEREAIKAQTNRQQRRAAQDA